MGSSILETARERESAREPVALVPTQHDGRELVADVRRDKSGALVESGGAVVKRLAVCERGGALVLACEREKSAEKGSSERVKIWRATSALADIADAQDVGLF